MEKRGFTLEGSQGQATPQTLPIPGALNENSIPVDESQHDENKDTHLGEANSAHSSTSTPGDTGTASTTISGGVPTSNSSHAGTGSSHMNRGCVAPGTDANNHAKISESQAAGTADARPPERKPFHTITVVPANKKGTQDIIEKWITEEELLEFNVEDTCGPTAIFMPRITEILKMSETFRTSLAAKFAMDSFFLTNTAYDSNGFFLERTKQETDTLKDPVIAYGCRFLVKELSLVPDTKELEAIEEFVHTCFFGTKPPGNDQPSMQIRSSSADIVSLDDDSVDTLIGKLQDKVDMIAPNLQDKIPKQKPEPGAGRWSNRSDFRDALDSWLEKRLESVAEAHKNQQETDEKTSTKDLHGLIVNILHRTYHDLGCICEVKEEKQIKSATSQTAKQPKDDPTISEVQEQPNGILKRALESIRYGKPRLADTEKGHPVVKTKAGTPPSKEKESPSNEKRPPKRNYHWLFLSFWSVFLYPSGQATATGEVSKLPKEVILCFDNASGSRMKKRMEAILSEQYPRSVLPQVIEEIVHMYDDALWGFRTPVRDVEKLRGQHMPKRNPDNNDAQEKDESDRRRQNYFDMHELSRHLIHSQETLSAAETTLKAILGSQQPRLVENRAGEISRFSELFIKNLRFRAAAFVERLNNEISLALHINNLKQLDKVEELLTENKMDGKDVTKAVGYASVLFLPGTFISGFFSMPFFDYDGSGWPNASKVWIWVAVAFPMTTIAFLWLYWSRTRTQNLARKKLKVAEPS